MSDNPRLVIIEESEGYQIAWHYPDDLGAVLGEDRNLGSSKPPKNREDWEDWKAQRVAAEYASKRGTYRNSSGWVWETRSEATKVLKLIKESFKHERELPEWAVTALEQGWKPPKGWRA